VNVQIVRYVTAAAIAVALLALLAVIGIAIARGLDITSSQLIGLLAFVGTLVALLANLLGTSQVASQLGDVQEKVNGHLSRHVGHSDAEVAKLVDERLRQHGLTEYRPPKEEI
jgi:hypothetical protein